MIKLCSISLYSEVVTPSKPEGVYLIDNRSPRHTFSDLYLGTLGQALRSTLNKEVKFSDVQDNNPYHDTLDER